jgi:hypothetical protein
MANDTNKRVTVLTVKDGGSVGSFWELEFWLSADGDGGYSVGCEQTNVYKEDRKRIPTEHHLMNGDDVWYALAGMVSGIGAYSIDDYNLDEIVAAVAGVNETLAREVRAAAAE